MKHELIIVSEEQDVYATNINGKFILVNSSLEPVDGTGQKVSEAIEMPAEYIAQVKELNGTKEYVEKEAEEQQLITFTPEEYRKHIAEQVSAITKIQITEALDEFKRTAKKEASSFANQNNGNISPQDMKSLLAEAFKMAQQSSFSSVDKMIMTEVPTEDLLEEPVIFYARQQTYTIWSDFRKGFEIRTPYKRPIHFTNVMRSKSQTAGGRRNADVIAVSACQIISKKELEFLEQHSDYGIKFFKNIAGTVERENDEYRFLEEAAREVGTNELELIQKAQAFGIPVDMRDMSLLRRKIIEKVAKEKLNASRAGLNIKTTIDPEYFKLGQQ
jgi:hypothetical protein